jgi:hypothetical protein
LIFALGTDAKRIAIKTYSKRAPFYNAFIATCSRIVGHTETIPKILIAVGSSHGVMKPIRCGTEYSRIVYSVGIGPPQAKFSFLSSTSANPATIRIDRGTAFSG